MMLYSRVLDDLGYQILPVEGMEGYSQWFDYCGDNTPCGDKTPIGQPFLDSETDAAEIAAETYVRERL